MTWSEPTVFCFDVQTFGPRVMACCSCTWQWSQPAMCSRIEIWWGADLPGVAAWACPWAVVARAAAARVTRTAAIPRIRRAPVMSTPETWRPPSGAAFRACDTTRRPKVVAESGSRGRDVLQVCQPRGRGRVAGHPPVATGAHRAAGRDLGAVGQCTALELAGEEPPAEHLEPAADLAEVVGRAQLHRVARRPLPRLGVMPGMPGQEGDLGGPVAAAQHVVESEVL